jgi:hypothetical protein
MLISQLQRDQHEAIHVINRAHLVDDVFALAATRTVSYRSSALRSLLAYIGRMFSHTAHHRLYKVLDY